MVVLAPLPSPEVTRDIVEKMIAMTGRLVTFNVVESVSGCELCNLDPVSNTSTDSFCPLCSGEYWIPTYSGIMLSGHIVWGVLDEKTWSTAGLIDNGQCTVKVLYTEQADYVAHNSAYIEVDDRIMQTLPGGIILRGSPNINRIILKLQEKER